jgi:two-component system response regulator AtoC
MKSVSSPAERTLSAKVLLVDGNQHGLTARGMILREQGYTVETVSSGEDAWELIQQTHFDVLITAYGMKGMCGAELIAKMHAAGLAARIILLMTHAEALSLDADLIGADETISKSNREVAELLRAVKRLAEDRPKRRPPMRQKARKRPASRKASGA